MAHLSLYSTPIRHLKAVAVLAALPGAILKIFTGSMPADGDTAPAGTLLGTFTLANPAGTESNGVITFTAPAAVAAIATGTAAVAQLLYSDGVTKATCFNAGVTGGGFCLELNSTAIQSGANISVTAFSWTEPGTGA